VETRAIVAARMHRLRVQLANGGPVAAAAAMRISEFEKDPDKFLVAKPVSAPPGMPIGEEQE